MTVQEALKQLIGFPIQDGTILAVLIKRGVTGTQEADSTNLQSQAFELATADVYRHLATVPSSISEGGYSVGVADQKRFTQLANDIYVKYGQPIIGIPSVRDKSEVW